MSSPGSSPYEPLPSKTSIRVLLLAPGSPEDEIFCWLLPIDLNADHKRFPSSPAPVDIISVVHGTSSDGSERKFLVPFDVYWDESKASPPMHPFQRYTALSYVWGDTENPEYVMLDGVKKSVTRNLHDALKALRRQGEGLCVWVDALCINQADFEEKKVQIGLMDRVYRQAEKVVAYLPQREMDQGNLQDLVQRIWEARKKHEERNPDTKSLTIGKEESKEQIGKIPIPALEPKILALDSTPDGIERSHAAQLQDLQKRASEKAGLLEDFGLPPVDSPLWGSWRRFFASPYFRRIWILQEFALASSLHFCLGSKILDMEHVMVAYHFVKEYSGVVNAHYLGHSQPGDPEDLTRLAIAGAQGAEMMFLERVLAGNGGKGELLLEKLRRGRGFEASDPRDKIYALLGLAKDGEVFAEHVSYAPGETPAMVFTRFAGLFVEKGYVFEVLLQAGLSSCDVGLPSWVPNWASSPRNTDILSPSANETEQSSTVQILPNNKLSIRGTLTDEILHLSNPFIQPSPDSTPAPGRNLTDFMRALVKSFLLILKTLVTSEESFSQAMEAIFQLLIQKDPPQTPAETEEITSLRTGFGACLAMFKTWATNLGKLEEGKMLVVDGEAEEKNMFMAFLQRALQTTAHRRMCVTRMGWVGLVPDGAEVGDVVVEFCGCERRFVLRKVGKEEEDEDEVCWRLVGSGCLLRLGVGGGLDDEAEKQDIVLM